MTDRGAGATSCGYASRPTIGFRSTPRLRLKAPGHTQHGARSAVRAYVERKLYIHNMGHAAVAYLGALKGYRYIWEAVGEPAVASMAGRPWRNRPGDRAEQRGSRRGPPRACRGLFARFANRKLGDTIERVGRDLPRKLGPRDRMAGALGLCAKHGLPRVHIAEALAAALLFEDSASTAVKDEIAAEGPRSALRSFCGLSRKGRTSPSSLRALRGAQGRER